MKRLYPVLFSVVFLLVALGLRADPVVEIYSVPPTEVVNTDYTVKVNGQAVPVIESGHVGDPSDPSGRRVYAHFSFSGEVEIEVTGLNNHALLPEEFGIVTSEQTSDRIVFTIDRPRYMILSRKDSGGTTEDALFLFADPIDPRAPNPAAPEVLNYTDFTGSISAAIIEVANRQDLDVLYIPPGTYENQGVIDMQSDMTLYVAGGAKINNGVVRFKDVENAQLRGRGVLEFDRSGSNDFSFGIYTMRSHHIRIEGLIARTASNWNTVPRRSTHVEILYLKALNSKTP